MIETEMVVCANKVRFEDTEPDYVFEDKDFVRLANDSDFRRLVLKALNKTAIVVGRLGSRQNDGSYTYRMPKPARSLVKDEVRTEMGYYARLQRAERGV